MNKKDFRFYLSMIMLIIAVIGLFKYYTWASQNSAMDFVILLSAISGLVLNIFYLLKNTFWLPILITTLYSIAGIKVITNSVGSFIDAFQGINMFGDASQVNSIVSISMFFLIGTLIAIIAGFVTTDNASRDLVK